MTLDPDPPQPLGPKTPSRLARRGFMLGGVALIATAGIAAAKWFNVTADVGEGALSASQAHEQAIAGQITLVDIRRPDEWARTGVPEGGIALDMRSADFTEVLLRAVQGDKGAPIALICARGVRSYGMSVRLKQAGFTQILDVPEGMLGSGAGPGWVKRGLPVVMP